MESFALKQCVGIDISKRTFTACLCQYELIGEHSAFSSCVDFPNNKAGFDRLIKWCSQLSHPDRLPLYLLEATGVYGEQLAYFLHEHSQSVCIVLPTRVKYFARTLNIKSKTDAIDAKLLALMGVQQSLARWEPPDPIYRKLRSLTRLYHILHKQRAAVRNHLEAQIHARQPHPLVMQTHKKLCAQIEKSIDKVSWQIRSLVDSDSSLAKRLANLETIKGVGFITVATVVAETQGFALIRSRKQLASYAGLDVVERQSGTSIKAKTRISKKGNTFIRAALYFPAMVAATHNPEMRNDYLRIIDNGRAKKIGLTALQRKILVLMYTLWKTNQPYSTQ